MGSKIQTKTLQTQALEALEKSTKMFEVAITLLQQGNKDEADRIRNEARRQRTLSVWLMANANAATAQVKTPTGRLHAPSASARLTR